MPDSATDGDAEGLIDTAGVRALLFDLGGVVIALDFQRVFTNWALAAGGDSAEISSRFSADEAYLRHELGELDASGYFASLRSSLSRAQ